MTKILIVDDSKVIRQFIHETFTEFGFTDVSEAINGLDGLQQAKSNMPDLITLDWNMPLMDGMDFIKALRKLPGGEKPKVILCTYERGEDKIKMALSFGIDAYVPKPVTPEMLKEKLAKLGLL